MLIGLNLGHDASISIFSKTVHVKTSLSERQDGVKQSSHLSLSGLSFLNQYLCRQKNETHVFGITCTQGVSFTFENEDIFSFAYSLSKLSLKDYWRHASKYWGIPYKYQWSRSKKDLNIPWIHHAILKPRDNYKEKPIMLGRDQIKKHLLVKLNVKLIDKIYDGYCVDHHLAHLYSAAAICKSDKFLVVSIDGAGSDQLNKLPLTYAGIAGFFTNRALQHIESLHFGGGIIYSIGAKLANMPEGKVMGLSSYIYIKNPEKIDLEKSLDLIEESHYCKEIIKAEILRLVEEFSDHLRLRDCNDLLRRNLPENWIVKVAAISQALYEICHERLVRHLISRYPETPFVFTGGCTLNCPANTRVLQYGYEAIFDPCCNDEGIATGSALCIGDLALNVDENYLSTGSILDPRRGSYLCNRLSRSEILNLYPQLQVHTGDIDSRVNRVYELLKANKVGAIAVGRYEIGPRALCNRSIIGRVDIAENHFLINRIKQREQWRPLAPVTTPESFSQYFKGQPNEYMLTFSKVITDRTPAVCHVDNTSRVQILTTKNHPVYSLLESIGSGCLFPPVLINTSLNSKDQPIINDLHDLLLLMDNSQLSFVLTDEFLIEKSNA